MTTAATGYEQDLAAWSTAQAAAIRAGRWAEVDAEHVAEEIEALGASDRRAMESRFEILIEHLFKRANSAPYRESSWERTVVEQRRRLMDLFDESPSLRTIAAERFGKSWTHVYRIMQMTDHGRLRFPKEPVFTWERALDDDFDFPLP